MQARGVIGKRIVRVYQHRLWDTDRSYWVVSLEGFELDDGSFIRFGAAETIDSPVATGHYPGARPASGCNLVTPDLAKAKGE